MNCHQRDLYVKTSFVAIDGHNLIAIRLFRNEPIEVIVANSPSDGLLGATKAIIERNKELAEKFDTALTKDDESQRKVF